MLLAILPAETDRLGMPARTLRAPNALPPKPESHSALFLAHHLTSLHSHLQDVPGRPGFSTILRRISELWGERRADIKQQSAASMEKLAELMAPEVYRHARVKLWNDPTCILGVE